ncbi:uncharacterized protein LOC134541413 isoform X2 [Bacillus rossius redtenbacheri]|uniref:uncharacterized protein LOC134541413 isoform X2 n=1 Tax=Bacillus rossius redtenbacheri TaxID=93214 RepID=UPI002FDDE21F
MSYNNYKPMNSYGMSRGRGFNSRGGYRGRGGTDGGPWSSTPMRGRGSFSSSRGRFNWYKDHSGGYDGPRYSGGDGRDKYSSRGRGDDSGYRRYNRMDGPGYQSRDRHGSPDSPRKRMRTEHGYVQTSSRRSHDGGYGGSDYSNRYNYSDEKGSYGDRGRGYRDDRRSSGGFRDRSREDYIHRKSEDSGMPPPSGMPTRHMSRGTFRGRMRGTRGFTRILTRRADSFLVRRRGAMDYLVRKRILTSRTQADNLRRLKLQKLRRLKELALKKDKDDNDSTKPEDLTDDEDKPENWDESEEKNDKETEGEAGEKKVVKTKKVKKVKEEPEEGEEVDEDEDGEGGEKEDDDEKGEEGGDGEVGDDEEADVSKSSKKSEGKLESGVHITIKQDSDSRAVSEEDHPRRTNYRTGRPFIRLHCPVCYMRCVTFKEYSMHLFTTRHENSMYKLSLRHKQTLARMRMKQRREQRVIEESEEVLSAHTNFCHICKLNYRQMKGEHQSSESHASMKRFLMPMCNVCEIRFRSPMQYENHLCSLDHIKRKAHLRERMDREREEKEEGSEDDKDINMENFMILDSVGTVDESGDDSGDGEGKPDKEKKDEDKKGKQEIVLGSEYVKLMEVYFCDLCHIYLPRLEPKERAIPIHCRSRTHLQCYVRFRDDRALRREAERIHRKEVKEKEQREAVGKKEGDDKDSEEKEAEKGEAAAPQEPGKKGPDPDAEAGMDDKLWADVDKDIGELLREVEPGKSSDEEDDSRSRYDRFRNSVKGGALVAGAEPAQGEEEVAKEEGAPASQEQPRDEAAAPAADAPAGDDK